MDLFTQASQKSWEACQLRTQATLLDGEALQLQKQGLALLQGREEPLEPLLRALLPPAALASAQMPATAPGNCCAHPRSPRRSTPTHCLSSDCSPRLFAEPRAAEIQPSAQDLGEAGPSRRQRVAAWEAEFPNLPGSPWPEDSDPTSFTKTGETKALLTFPRVWPAELQPVYHSLGGGRREYTCRGCDMLPFPRRNKVWEHVATTHSRQVACCPCGFRFPDPEGLLGHLYTTHGAHK